MSIEILKLFPKSDKKTVSDTSGMKEALFAVLPRCVSDEMTRLARSRTHFFDDLSEVRVRAGGTSALVLAGENVPLFSTVTPEETGRVVDRLCHGSLYAFRDALAGGYLPYACGIRVGVSGQARYEQGMLVGIGSIRSLVFRIPHGICASGEALYEAFLSDVTAGMLIYSPPGVGKTTALRTLAGMIGSGPRARRVAVIDEREEFSAFDYTHAAVDILTGYGRALGIEIATRTLNPEVLMVDEIGGAAEADAILGVLHAGVPLIASVHAASLEEVQKKKNVLPLIESGIFRTFAGLKRENAKYSCQIDVLP